MAQMLPYQSLFFLSKLPTSSSTLAAGVMTCHAVCNLLDIFSRSASSDYAINLPFNFHGRFSTLKVYLQSFLTLKVMLLFRAEQDAEEPCSVLIHSSNSVKVKYNYENKSNFWSSVRLESFLVLQK